MKRTIFFLLVAALLMSLCACAGAPEATEPPAPSFEATQTDIDVLEGLYAGRTPFYGELHDHSNSGGRSDGRIALSVWKSTMPGLGMDFAAIQDHKQVRHMYLPEWDNSMFIGGTEAAGKITDINVENAGFHYNMMFATPEPLLEIFEEFPEFKFEGTPEEGSFPYYPSFDKARLQELIRAIQDKGGLFVHVHPAHEGYFKSQDPMDYWFADWTGFEVVNTYRSDRNGPNTQKNYAVWTAMLAGGKRVWATAGNDEHGMPVDKALCAVYAEERLATSYMEHLRVGDLTCGPVGIRMGMGSTLTGSECDFTGQRLVFSVGDFHSSVKNPYDTYRMDLITEAGVVYSQEISCEQTTYFALDADPGVMFYRVEVYNVTENSRIAIGNPIWNTNVEVTQ